MSGSKTARHRGGPGIRRSPPDGAAVAEPVRVAAAVVDLIGSKAGEQCSLG
jgi:hypothetical protein